MTLVTSQSKLMATKPVHSEPGYVEFPGESGDFLSAAHAAALVPAGDFSIIVHLSPDDLTPTAEGTFIGKFTTSGGQRAYRVSLMPAGHIRLTVSPDGVNVVQPQSTAILDAARVGTYGVLVAIVFDSNNGAAGNTAYFLTRAVNSPNLWPATVVDDPNEWTPLGNPVVNAGVLTIHPANTATLNISGHTNGTATPFDGKVRWASIRTGMGAAIVGDVSTWFAPATVATEVFRLDPRIDLPADPAVTSFESTSGHLITVNRSGSPSTTLVPSVYRGAPTGIGDWRLVIERMNGTGAVWGAFKWGTVDPVTGLMPKWGSMTWDDITDRCDGWESWRGADEPNGRPRVGDITLTVVNDDFEFDPWVNYSDVRPGVILRAGYVSIEDPRADGWLPRWTGVVEDWPVEYHGVGAQSRCVVTIAETLSTLATIDGNAVAAVGAGESLAARVIRLADAAQWGFGIVADYPAFSEPDNGLQSTTMAGNRIAELYLSADSSTSDTSAYKGIVRSDVTGALLITSTAAHERPRSRLVDFSYVTLFGFRFPTIEYKREPDSKPGTNVKVDYVADSVESANNADGIWNDHRYARVGGTQQVVKHAVSIGRFRKQVTRARGDLICQTDAEALRAARHDSDTEARTALRVEAVDVEVASDRPLAFLALMAMDLGESIWLYPPASVGFSGSAAGRIRSISELCIPGAGTVESVISVALDFYSFTDLPGVQLPVAP